MANVYAWPPVGLLAAEWSMTAPVATSRSLVTGGEFVSAAQRRRRVATLEVSALALGRNGAGYMEVLKRLLDGGVHLVRLTSTPINWHLDAVAEDAARPRPMTWIVPPGGIGWEVPPGGIDWWTSGPSIGTAGTVDGWPVVTVTGLPPGRMIARPGEFVTLGDATAMVLRPAWSDDAGEAVIRLVTPLEGDGPCIVGARETAVFAADAMPRAMQPLGQNWSYQWQFTQVFEDEGRGPFVEVDPWT